MINFLKFNKPEQFPKDEILDEDERLVRSWMTVEVKDKQGDVVPIDQIEPVMDIWMKRDAPIIDEHSNKPIGKAIKWTKSIHKETGKEGIILDYKIHKDYLRDHQAWEEIKSGKRTGLSIGGSALGLPEIKVDDYSGDLGKYLKNLELYEVSSVYKPANQYGKTIAVNHLAKSNKDQVGKIDRDELEGFIATHKNPKDSIVHSWAESKGYEVEEVEEAIYQLAHEMAMEKTIKKEDKIPGGLAQGKKPEDFDQEKLKEGIKVEMEHTSDSKVASEIAMDHLTEDPNYYIKLKEVEKQDYVRDGTGPHGQGKGPGQGQGCNKEEIKKPFADFSSHTECVDRNQDKENPHAYCAAIEHESTGKWPAEKKEEENPIIKALLSKSKDINTQKIEKTIEFKKNFGTEVSKMSDVKKEGYETEAQEAEDKKKPSPENRLTALENNVGKILKMMETSKAFSKEEDSKEDKKEDMAKEEEKPEDKEEVDKKKAIETGTPGIGTEKVNPNPEGGEAKSPKAPAGETNETAKPENSKTSEELVQKMESIMKSQIEQFAKSMGIVKSTTPRLPADANVAKSNKSKDLGMDIIKRAKEGNISIPDMNREINDFRKSMENAKIKEVLDFVEG